MSDPISQRDVIFSKGDSLEEWQNPKDGREVIRLRYMDDIVEFTYKQQISSEKDKIEHESSVGNPEEIHNILARLGFTPKFEVNKVRRKGKIGEYEICLDEVKGLGSFVEIEKLTDEDINPEEVNEELLLVLESFGLSRKDAIIKGYDT